MIYHPRNILITGASSGLGASLANIYAEPNITLFLTGRNQTRLEEIVNICKKKGARVYSKVVDVRDAQAMHTWIDSILIEKMEIDLVIANAGISAGPKNGIESTNQVKQIFDTNLQGVLNTILPIIPSFINREAGQIALISSLAGYRGLPNCPAYSASKAAVKAYGEALRGALSPYRIGITVVTPGYITTPLTARNRFPMPFIMSAEKAASIIKNGLKYNPALLAFPWPLYFMVRLMNILPSILIDFILTKLPAKDSVHNSD